MKTTLIRFSKFILLIIPLFFFLACFGLKQKNKQRGKDLNHSHSQNHKTQQTSQKEQSDKHRHSGKSGGNLPTDTVILNDSENQMIIENKGVGPIDNVQLAKAINLSQVNSGKNIFNKQCIVCHRIDAESVGPPLRNIIKRRSPEWIMNMILNPVQMLDEDPIAQGLLKEYGSPMLDLDLSKDEARDILEYFRTI